MQIFGPVACGNTADTTNGCQMMSYSHLEKDFNKNEHLTLFGMGFLRAAHGWVEDKDAALPKIYHNDETWHSYTLPKKDPKNPKKYMNRVTHPLSSAGTRIFSLEIRKFFYIKKYMYRLHFDTEFLILLTFLEFLKIALIKMS